MTPSLPQVFLQVPLAHRALHDLNHDRPENSRAAIRAAIMSGYGIEIDLQLSVDGQAMVFHDYDLSRLTDHSGPVRLRTAQELGSIRLTGGDGETIPTLPEVLEIVRGQVPLLIELKDQDGAMGDNIGPLESATATALAEYGGPVAVMSFNPHSVGELSRIAPHVPRGITTSDYNPADWPLSTQTCDRLREIPDFDRVKASFISHQSDDLARERIQSLRHAGVPVLCWTIRTPKAEAEARKYADNITFENYAAPFPA